MAWTRTPLLAPRPSAEAAVIDLIRISGTTSRADLVEATGLTGATISTVVRRLIEAGIVVETGRAESTGGKPRTLLELNHAARYAVGVHLDHAGTVYVVTTVGGAVVGRMSRAGLGVEDPPEVVDRIAREVAVLVRGVGVDRERVLGVGVVAPGPLAPGTAMRVRPPQMREWRDFPLEDALARALGAPVLLENDATAAALGEHWTGRAGTRATFATVYMGTGVGAGLIVDGQTFGGVSGNAGEIGHICLDPAGPECWCGARGCTEALGGPAVVVERARADADVAAAAGLGPVPGDRSTVVADFGAVTRAALRGHTGALALLEEAAGHVAVAVRTLAEVLDLDLVVLTGPSLAVAGSVYQPVLQAELDRWFFGRLAHGVEVRLSPVARTSAAMGAAAMVMRSELVPRRGGAAAERLTEAALPVQHA